ncbi:GNAT family N-acetyltransferase [Bacillus sp. 03113]|uniref:GNAT family N-acetyltransferase n=1 Tax=Bacillus sp. 03113 TaxID=2578211 RepID=UPI0011449338|nr:GNAT family N-acetyltransferase [Bacillus sp. 03113]
MEIKRINKEQTWELRQKVMWPNKDIEYIKLTDDDESIHFGFFHNEKLLSVITLFIENDCAQFRKFATLQEEQGKGIGSKMLDHLITEAKQLGVKKLWCNARQNKASFYQKFGLKETDQIFDKEGVRFVIMEMYL